MENLKALIAYIIVNVSYKISRTELVKLIYWFEYLRVQTFGKQLTDVQFIRYKHGPFAAEILSTVDIMRDEGLVEITNYKTRQGYLSYLHSVGNLEKLREYKLSKDDQFIASITIKNLSGLPFEDLLKKIYSTPPMERILEKEKRMGISLSGEKIDMKESKKIYKVTKEKLVMAKERRLARTKKGTDEEYLKCIINEFNEMEDVRRRANICHQ